MNPTPTDPTPRLDALLARVRARIGWSRFGRRWYAAFLVCAVVFGVAFGVSRLTGWQRQWFVPRTLLVLPVVGAGIALASRRRTSRVDAARAIDRRYDTHDLVLTATTPALGRGDFHDHVRASAETRAADFEPRAVVPLHYRARLGRAAITAAVLAAAVVFIPELASADRDDVVETRRKTIAAVRDTNRARAEAIARDDDTPDAKALEKELARMADEIRKMKPETARANRQRITAMRRSVAERWRDLRARQAAERRAWNERKPRFGGDRERRELREALERGDLSKLREAMRELEKQMNAEGSTPEDRAEVRRKLEQLADFARREMGDDQLASALDRARQMAEMSELPGLNAGAAEALAESLDLAKSELDRVQQTLESLQRLEDAMQALREAEKAGGCPPSGDDPSTRENAMKELAEAYRRAREREEGG